MPKIKVTLQTRKQNYTSLQAVFRSENGAIDLASIMVGIIVIGLIGGVIAATVFAVIPWSQDNAAKQQLESIHTAENAFYGLSSDPTANLTGGKVNTFADSPALKTAALLAQAATYCVVPSTNGKGYTGFVKSASGKIFYAQNSNKSPQVLTTGTLPCTSAGVYDSTNPPAGVDIAVAGGPTGGTAPEPTYTTVHAWDFETDTQGWVPEYSFTTISNSTVYKQAGSSSLYVQGTSTYAYTGASRLVSNLEVGASYRVTVWTYAPNSTTTFDAKDAMSASTSVSEAPVAGWTKTVITVPSAKDTLRLLINAQRGADSTGPVAFYIDTVTIEKMNP